MAGAAGAFEEEAGAFLAASRQLERQGPGAAAAEGVVLGLRKSPHAVALAQRVLREGSVGSFAQFQAALLLRHAAVEQWSALPVEPRHAVRQELVALALAGAGAAPGAPQRLERVVWMQCVHTASVLWKRGWLDDDVDPGLTRAKEELFEGVAEVLRTRPVGPQTVVMLRLLVALVDEFNSAKASAIGLSFSFHRRCHESFERVGLREAFRLACEVLAATRTTAVETAIAASVVRSCLALIEVCLGWEFRLGGSSSGAPTLSSESEAAAPTRSGGGGAGSASAAAAAAAGQWSKVEPGPQWRELLGDGALIACVTSLYLETRAAGSAPGAGAEELPHQLRQVLVLLSSVNGTVFADDHARARYADAVLQACLFRVLGAPLVPLAAAAGLSQTFESNGRLPQHERAPGAGAGAGGEPEAWAALCAAGSAEFLDMCSLLSRLAGNFGPQVLALLGPRLMPALEALLSLSSALLEGAAVAASRGAAAAAASLQPNSGGRYSSHSSSRALSGSLSSPKSSFSKALATGPDRQGGRDADEDEDEDVLGGAVHDDGLDVDNSWLMEAFGHVLEVWVGLSSWASSVLAPQQLARARAQAQAPGGDERAAADEVALAATVCACAARLFAVYTERRLEIARAAMERESCETFQEDDMAEDPTVLEDHLAAVAALGRVDAASGVAVLLRLFGSRLAALQRVAADAPSPAFREAESGKLSEELFWAVQLTVHVLSDSCEGERPMVPRELLRLSAAFCDARRPASHREAMEDPVAQLSWLLLHCVEFESRRVASTAGGDEQVSPLLSAKLLAALARWSHSYLAPEVGMYGALQDSGVGVVGGGNNNSSSISAGLPVSLTLCFGANEHGVAVIDFLVQCSSVYLSHWGVESAVSGEALRVLRAVVDNPGSRKLVLQLASWETLFQAHARSAASKGPDAWAPLNGLTSQGHGALLEVLLRSLDCSREERAEVLQRRRELFLLLTQPVSVRLAAAAQRLVSEAQASQGRTAAALEDPAWALDLERLAQCCLGVMRAADNGPLAAWCRTAALDAIAFEWARMAAAALLCIQRAGVATATSTAARAVLALALELVSTFVRDQLTVAPAATLPRVYGAAAAVIQCYRDFYVLLGAGLAEERPAAAAARIMEEEAWPRDVFLLLQMLRTIADRDVFDVAESEAEPAMHIALPHRPPSTAEQLERGLPRLDAASVVLQGVALIFPLVTKDLLQYPGVAEQLFQLLTAMLHAFPTQVASLSPPIFAPIVQALEFGMLDHRTLVSRMSLEALSTLAEFHVGALAQGQPGLGPNLYLQPGGGSVLLHLLQQVFSFVVFQTFDASLLNPAANAMLALIACERERFRSMVDGIVHSQGDPALQQRLAASFHNLTTSNGVQLNFQRKNRNRFQDNLVHFVNEVRGFMRRK